jgi:hypothetical protein
VHSRLDVGPDDRVLHLLGGRERGGIDLLKTTAEACESANVRVDRGSTQVLEQIVMDMNAVRARLAGQGFIEIGEVIVDKVGKWLRWVHSSRVRSVFCVP